jgi:hypothetical protein
MKFLHQEKESRSIAEQTPAAKVPHPTPNSTWKGMCVCVHVGVSMGEGVTFMTRRTNDSIEYIIAYKAKTKVLHHLKQRKTCKLLQFYFF